ISRKAPISTLRCPTTSSSATPSPPAASTSRRRRSWGRTRPTSRPGRQAHPTATRRGARREGGRMTLLTVQGVCKRYGGVHALRDADVAVEAGRVHAVLGENGAGKSTLIKIMSGVVQPDEGTILLDGRAVSLRTPAAANEAGIVCIFQELSLIP